MKITSQQKKFALPLIGLAISLTGYIKTLGTAWSFVFALPMGACVAVFLSYNGERIFNRCRDWFDRDGW